MWGRPYIEELEKEFKTQNLRNKHILHDLNIRVSDPEEFRRRCVNTLADNGYKVELNEMVEFEDPEFKTFFRGGRLKPIKNIIKGVKEQSIGARYPLLWKALILLGLVCLTTYFLPFEELNKSLLFNLTIILLLLGLSVFLIKESASSYIWIKTVGIYDVEGVKADLRVLISADTDTRRKQITKSLKDDVAYLYDELARRYIKKIAPKERMIKEVPESKTAKVVENIAKINRQMDELREKFISGRVSEDVYRDIMSSLKHKKDKLETILDLVTL